MRPCLVLLALLRPAIAVSAQGTAPASAAELEEMVHRDSNDATLHYQLGLVYASEHQGDKAKAAFLTAVRIDPQFAPAYVALGRLGSFEMWGGMLVPGKGSDSVTLMWRRAFQLDPLTEISKTSGYYEPIAWRMTIDHALKMYHEEKYKQSRDEFGALIDKTTKSTDPDAVPAIALWYHALAAVRLGMPDSAIPDVSRLLDRVMRMAADSSKHEPRGLHEFRLELQREITSHYEYVLAYLHQLAGHADEAIGRYEHVSEGDLGLYGPHLQLARIHEGTGNWVQAILERRRAIDASPDDPSLVFDLGVTLLKASAFAEADTVLHQSIVRNPRESRAYYALGLTLERLGRTAEAKAAFTQFLDLAPRRMDAQLGDARQHLASLQ